MNTNEIVAKVIDAIQRCNISFMIVGSFSSNIYGVERSTQDVDIVLRLESRSINDLIQALGPDFYVDPQIGFETVTMTSRFIASHLNPHFKIELFMLSDDAHDLKRFERRRTLHIRGRTVDFPTPEDVIITKLRWSKGGRRTKDIDDVRNVLSVQQGHLDLPYIRHWCAQYDTLDLFEKTLASVPPLP